MKHLILMRHAKSSWKFPQLADIDRPLNKRGRRDAPVMAARLAKNGPAPERILCSPAVRALRTAQALVDVFDVDSSALVIDDIIYGAGAGTLIERIRQLEPDVNVAALVGHNPDMTDLICQLSGDAIDNVPTSGVARIGFDISTWEQLDTGLAPVEYAYDFPKNNHA